MPHRGRDVLSHTWVFSGNGPYRLDGASGCWLPADGVPQFNYTDGAEIERRLLEVMRGARDRSVLSEELRAAITDWPSRYHLSPRRANLLRPVETVLEGRKVLEVGAGCGAISRYLGECGAEVLALEGSLARARIAAIRCCELANVKVLVEQFHILPAVAEFDVVCLVGVLEYARLFFPGVEGDAVDAMLAHAVKFLRPGGRLLLAIENQLGLKYFAGYREDHVGQAMFGIEDLYTHDGVVTFGRRELARRLHAAGLAELEWLYPFPDYKLPVSVLTESGVACVTPDLAPILSGSVVADPQEAEYFRFSLEQAWQTVYRNGLAGELANSFLVIASAGAGAAVSDTTLVYHYACERRRAFNKAVHIIADGTGARVRGLSLEVKETPSIGPLHLRLDEEPFVEGVLWQVELFRRVNRPDWQVADIGNWVEAWLAAVADQAALPVTALHPETPIRGRLVDAVPRNLIMGVDGPEFIDLEWVLDHDIEFGHLLFRGLIGSLLSVSSVARPAPGTPRELLSLVVAVARNAGVNYPETRLARDFAFEAEFQILAAGSCWAGLDALARYQLPTRPELRPREAGGSEDERKQPGNIWHWRVSKWLRRAVPRF